MIVIKYVHHHHHHHHTRRRRHRHSLEYLRFFLYRDNNYARFQWQRCIIHGMKWARDTGSMDWRGGFTPPTTPNSVAGAVLFCKLRAKTFSDKSLSHPCSHQGMSVLKFEFLKKIFSDTWKHPDKNLYFMSFEIVKCGFNILCCIC